MKSVKYGVMKMRAVALGAALCGLVWCVAPLQAATYYVAATGDDASLGTAASPWRTLHKAAVAVSGGDTVYVGPGSYTGQVNIKDKSGGSGYIQFLAQDPNNKPKVVAQSWENAAIMINNSSYIEINGFDVQAPASYGAGVNTENWSHHIRILNCVAHDCGQSGISSGGSSSTIPSNCDYLTISNNIVYNNCATGLADGSGISLYRIDWSDHAAGYHNFIQNNTIYNNQEYWVGTGYAGNTQHTDGNGIIVDVSAGYNGSSRRPGRNWSPPTYISGNNIYNNGGRGIHVYKCDSVTAEYNTVTNNLQDPSPLIQPGGELTAGLSHDVIYRNNTVTNINGRWTNFWYSTNIQQSNNTFKYS